MYAAAATCNTSGRFDATVKVFSDGGKSSGYLFSFFSPKAR